MEIITDMNKKEIRVIVPKGCEIDKEHSTFECIKFKPIGRITYEAIMNKLLMDKPVYFPDTSGWVGKIDYEPCMSADPNNCISEKQVEKLFAINKLINVATYLNDGWKPNWNATNENKYYICIVRDCICIDILNNSIKNNGIICFKSKELAQQAINILGRDTIKLAFSTDW